jgi:uncharacterized membrane protein (DUF373 family)
VTAAAGCAEGIVLPRRPYLVALSAANSVLHYAVAVVLLAIAVIVLWHSAYELANSQQAFVSATTTALNGVLFTIIILEVMRTVVAHLQDGGVQLQPFLLIGTISAVRSILAVGARLSLEGTQHEPSPAVVRNALLELGVNSAVVLGLALALVLIRRVAQIDED